MAHTDKELIGHTTHAGLGSVQLCRAVERVHRLIVMYRDRLQEAQVEKPLTSCGSDLSYRGQLSEGSSLEGASKGRLWRKGSRKGMNRGAQRVNALLSHLSYL